MLGLAHAGVWAATPNNPRLSARDGNGFMSAVVGQDKLRVLVVDDEESIRTFAGRILRDAGYDVAVASDGQEALRLVDAQPRPFDLWSARQCLNEDGAAAAVASNVSLRSRSKCDAPSLRRGTRRVIQGGERARFAFEPPNIATCKGPSESWAFSRRVHGLVRRVTGRFSPSRHPPSRASSP